jgi:hypothetical protein
VLTEQADHVEPLLGRHQRATVALDVADVDQALDDRRARGRRADPRVLHRLAQLLVVDELAGRLHRAEQRGVAVAPRRLGLLRERLDLEHLRWLALLEARQLLLARLVLVGCPVAVLRLTVIGEVNAAPAGDEQDLAARAEDVTGDRRLDTRVLEQCLGVKCGEEATHDEVVDAAVVVVHLLDRVLRACRDDRVVVGDLAVVDHAPERQHVEPSHVLGRGPVLRARREQLGGRLDLAGHVASQVARVRPGICERLVLLVESLRGAERARAEKPKRVLASRWRVVRS